MSGPWQSMLPFLSIFCPSLFIIILFYEQDERDDTERNMQVRTPWMRTGQTAESTSSCTMVREPLARLPSTTADSVLSSTAVSSLDMNSSNLQIWTSHADLNKPYIGKRLVKLLFKKETSPYIVLCWNIQNIGLVKLATMKDTVEEM